VGSGAARTSSEVRVVLGDAVGERCDV